nr:DUF2804 domain-containing protein [Pseudenhygromyxa sp. WMMC2535]
MTDPVALVDAKGRLNPDALGFTRQPLHDTSGLRRSWRGLGRNKRWEYWAVMAPSHVVALTVADLDYAALHSLWILDRASMEAREHTALRPFGRGTELPASLGRGPARARSRGLDIDIDTRAEGTRLRAEAGDLSLAIEVPLPEGHERLGVVVPWSRTRFQYTIKDVARPAQGWLRVRGKAHELRDGQTWAVLDHGRGRWPYRLNWNWGAGSGRVGERVIGVQLGGKWTVGTGATENALVVDGRLSKISEEFEWRYDLDNPLRPWRVFGERVELRFEPFYDRAATIDLGLFASRQHQCFGTWTGAVIDDAGERVRVDGVEGWAEDVRNRW